jgi:hypothetical protein
MPLQPTLLGQSPEELGDEDARQEMSEEQQQYFDFDTAKARLTKLISTWTQGEVVRSEQNRVMRNVDISTKTLRAEGKLKADETIIPMRVIDTNIKREQPPFVSYLKQSRRLVIFDCVDIPTLPEVALLERDFTKGMTYSGWETPHFKCLDGAQTHGWDAIEVVFDPSKPLHVALEHIGHDNLFFPLEALDLQTCDTILRRYQVTQLQLKLFVTAYGFSKVEVDKILDTNKDKKDSTLTIYKRFFKYEGKVFVNWFSEKADAWLLEPKPYYAGRKTSKQVPKEVPTGNVVLNELGLPIPEMTVVQTTEWFDVDETIYPVFILPYNETEAQKIFDHKGRCFYDKYKQEGMSAIWTGFVNSVTRASNVYASPANPSGTGGRVTKVDAMKLEPGSFYSEPVAFWHSPYPDPMMLKAAQALDVQNSQEAGQITYAVNNREDSRKTATEVANARQDQTLLNSVQVTLFSTFIRSIYSYAWLIIQSQALQNKVKFLYSLEQGQNRNDIIALNYDVRAAGDVDVIQRAEKLNAMKQDWPVIQNTPLASIFLQDLIKLSYPEDSDRYIQILQQGDKKKMLIQSLGAMLQSLVSPEEIASLPPETQQQLKQLQDMTMQVMQEP